MNLKTHHAVYMRSKGKYYLFNHKIHKAHTMMSSNPKVNITEIVEKNGLFFDKNMRAVEVIPVVDELDDFILRTNRRYILDVYETTYYMVTILTNGKRIRSGISGKVYCLNPSNLHYNFEREFHKNMGMYEWDEWVFKTKKLFITNDTDIKPPLQDVNIVLKKQNSISPNFLSSKPSTPSSSLWPLTPFVNDSV